MSDAKLQMAGGFVDITPTKPVALAGFIDRAGAFTAIHDPLEANALVLSDGSKRVLLVSFDLLYVGELRERISERLGDRIAPEGLWCAASHTHFAPATDPALTGLGAVDADYLEMVASRVTALCIELLDRLPQPATLRYREAPLEGAVNRRRNAVQVHLRKRPQRGVFMQPNPGGAIDKICRVLSCHGQADNVNPGAIVWNWACHPVAFPVRASVSAEYPGVVRRALRKRFGDQLPVLFLQGFAGNVRPMLVREPRGALERARRVANGAEFERVDLQRWQMWSAELSEALARLAGHPARVLSGRITTSRLCIPNELVRDPANALADISIQRFSLGGDMHLIGVSVEPMAELSALLRQQLGKGLIPVGYTDRTQVYLPTREMMVGGGYEAGAFLGPFGVHGTLSGDPEVVTRALAERL